MMNWIEKRLTFQLWGFPIPGKTFQQNGWSRCPGVPNRHRATTIWMIIILGDRSRQKVVSGFGFGRPKQGCTGQPFFALGQGGAGRGKKFQGGAGRKCSGQGGVTVKPLGITWGGAGRGGALLKIFRAGAPRGSHFPQGRGRVGRASMDPKSHFFASKITENDRFRLQKNGTWYAQITYVTIKSPNKYLQIFQQ